MHPKFNPTKVRIHDLQIMDSIFHVPDLFPCFLALQTHFWFPNVGQGTVALTKPIDYETVTEVALTICAKDSAEAQGFNATTTLTVRILDGDDQNPVFVDGPYKAYLREGESVVSISLNSILLDEPIHAQYKCSAITGFSRVSIASGTIIV